MCVHTLKGKRLELSTPNSAYIDSEVKRSKVKVTLLQKPSQSHGNLLLQKYEKPHARADGYKDLLMYNRKVFNARQTDALRGLYQWRDCLARQQDESTGLVVSVFTCFSEVDSIQGHVGELTQSLGTYCKGKLFIFNFIFGAALLVFCVEQTANADVMSLYYHKLSHASLKSKMVNLPF